MSSGAANAPPAVSATAACGLSPPWPRARWSAVLRIALRLALGGGGGGGGSGGGGEVRLAGGAGVGSRFAGGGCGGQSVKEHCCVSVAASLLLERMPHDDMSAQPCS